MFTLEVQEEKATYLNKVLSDLRQLQGQLEGMVSDAVPVVTELFDKYRVDVINPSLPAGYLLNGGTRVIYSSGSKHFEITSGGLSLPDFSDLKVLDVERKLFAMFDAYPSIAPWVSRVSAGFDLHK